MHRGKIIKMIDWTAPQKSNLIGLEFIDTCTALDTLEIEGFMFDNSNPCWRKIGKLTSLTELVLAPSIPEPSTEFLRFFDGMSFLFDSMFKLIYTKIGQ